MKSGPKASLGDLILIFLTGVIFTGAGAVALLKPEELEKVTNGRLNPESGALVLGAGIAALLGGVGMIRRSIPGFLLAGAAMLVMAVLKIQSLSSDSRPTSYMWIAVYLLIAAKAFYGVWKYREEIRNATRSGAAGWPGRETPRPAEPGSRSGTGSAAGVDRAASVVRMSGSMTGPGSQQQVILPSILGVATPVQAARSGPAAAATPARGARPAPPPDKTLSHLDAGDFAPVSPEELRRRASKVDRSLIFRFGLTSQIPPASDERTLLIDKALVAHGYLTPERLVEIHETGEAYLRLRPTMQSLEASQSAAAQRAVADDVADRAARREQKRAAAVERRARHAADVAQRRSTDIVFLGRGVSGGLSDRRANVEKLSALGLPVLTSPAEIAAALQLSIPRLRWLAFHSEASSVSHYVRFTIPKKSGGTRELAAPHHDIAAAQQWILINILERVPMRDCAHGFIKGRNIMSNAVPHVRRDAVVNADLKDFFPSITFPRVKGIFQGLGYSPAAATVLALLCTECPRRMVEYGGKQLHAATGPRALPQGACTSPALSNLAARKLDARLEGLAAKTGWTYTRYADDLTFSASGDTAAQCGGLLLALRRFCQEESFAVNEKKTRVQRQNAQQTVTGIVVNRRPNVPRDVYRRVRAILHNARKTGLAAQNRDSHPNFPMHVRGMIAWVFMANPDRGRKLMAAWDLLGK